ncbi:hypothetical protein [Nitrincola iocasae]|uniref:Uncharacterized protein n=1 Tax=Nitrincola iocasae TaxID=2614693 RepID=A0A5J6LC75_9GAMM|nr:hypothetical protein [Nitrincola iocasae]QEW05891.1 hypothetical protein F5I99_04975 [Nitrincola iocasae]
MKYLILHGIVSYSFVFELDKKINGIKDRYKSQKHLFNSSDIQFLEKSEAFLNLVERCLEYKLKKSDYYGLEFIVSDLEKISKEIEKLNDWNFRPIRNEIQEIRNYFIDLDRSDSE